MVVDEKPKYKIKKLLKKKRIRRGRGWATEYLVRWVKWGPEHNVWYNIKDLADASDLVREFEEQAQAEEEAVLL